MKPRPALSARLARQQGVRAAVAPVVDEAALTPLQRLVRAAERGEFEALVARARTAKAPAMVTPQEREAGLRAAGQWPEPKPAPMPVPQPLPAAEPEPELTPNEQYIAGLCHWRRGPSPAHRGEPCHCLTDYDPLAEEE